MSAPHSDAAGTSSGRWHRVHPLSPFLRAGLQLFAVASGLIVYNLGFFQRRIERGVVGRPVEDEPESSFFDVVMNSGLALGPGAVLVVGIVLGIMVLNWRFTAYRVGRTAVEFRTGVMSKLHRRAPFERVQSIDIRQRLAARIFGLAELVFDVAGGAGSNVTIGFLTRAQAEELRVVILERVRVVKGAQSSPSPQPGAASAQPNASAPHAGASGQHPAPDAHAGQAAPHQPTAHHPAPTAAASAPAADAPAHTRYSPDAPGMPAGAALLRRLQRHADVVGEDLSESFTELVAPYVRARRLGADAQVVRVPLHRSLLAPLLSYDLLAAVIMLFAVGIAAAVLAAVGVSFSADVTLLISVFFGIAVMIWSAVNRAFRHANFVLTLTPDGLQISRGLTSTEKVLIPVERLQSVRIVQPLLWRLPGWYSVVFNTASGSDVEKRGHTLLPVGTLDDVQTLMGLILPSDAARLRDTGTGEPQQLRPGGLVEEAALGLHTKPAGAPGVFAAQPTRTRWLDPLGRARSGWLVTEGVIAVRRGRLHRTADFVPLARVQSLCLRQGPIQRAFGVTTVDIHSTPGPVDTAIRHIDAAQGTGVLWDLAALTQRARTALDAHAEADSGAQPRPTGSAHESR